MQKSLSGALWAVVLSLGAVSAEEGELYMAASPEEGLTSVLGVTWEKQEDTYQVSQFWTLRALGSEEPFVRVAYEQAGALTDGEWSLETLEGEGRSRGVDFGYAGVVADGVLHVDFHNSEGDEESAEVAFPEDTAVFLEVLLVASTVEFEDGAEVACSWLDGQLDFTDGHTLRYAGSERVDGEERYRVEHWVGEDLQGALWFDAHHVLLEADLDDMHYVAVSAEEAHALLTE